MPSLKRMLRITVPVVTMMLGAAVFTNVPARAASCAHPGMVVSFMHRLGLADLKPCAVTVLTGTSGNGEICANLGHHCNDGSGSGKCQSALDTTTNTWSCQCLK